MTTAAAIDRLVHHLVHHATILELDRGSIRAEEARRRKDPKPTTTTPTTTTPTNDDNYPDDNYPDDNYPDQRRQLPDRNSPRLINLTTCKNSCR
jgi:heme-binding NEAT domain protein